ncbi:Hypothetical protein KFL_006420060 [Klebsormidium nitens]|uniref:DUF4460 domain-containing protein n=1 Tax=Klebsormidium nitens TaxID=105231 RepID=A0A1Y1IHV3_KLENI|nr:Hypothetical protein KFL_006420060 [Klebsormidium nitens]|eukprot:GAQ90460.1 Hypothetical protein KFL_006420060 [Klebsormidium nitens]
MQSLLTKAAWRQQWRGTLTAFLAQASSGVTGGTCQHPDCRAESFSSSAQGELQRAETPTIKSQLRMLYKRVHPDLFHGHPAERATNERSFKLLQEYLSVAHEGSHSPSRHFRFEFFLHPSEETPPPAPTSERTPNLEKVEVALPPPRHAFGTNGELTQSTRRALGKLFAACGLAADISSPDDDISIQSLGDLLRHAGETARQREADVMTSSRRMVIARNALRMGRGVKAVLQGPLLSAPAHVQAEALEKLAKALDLAPDAEVGGITFVLGGKHGLDAATGNVWLRWDAKATEWGARIAAVDMDSVVRAKQRALERQFKEAQVATVVGVEMVYTDHGVGSSSEYEECLDRLESHGRARGPVEGGIFSEVPLRVIRGGDEGVNGFEIDERMGFVSVPVGASAEEVWRFLEKRGQEALGIVHRFRSAEQRLADVSAHVRKKLRLRHLSFDSSISADQYLQCCTKLLRHASTLIQLTDGLSLCIGSVDRLPQEGEDPPLVHMRWNFSINSL